MSSSLEKGMDGYGQTEGWANIQRLIRRSQRIQKQGLELNRIIPPTSLYYRVYLKLKGKLFKGLHTNDVMLQKTVATIT